MLSLLVVLVVLDACGVAFAGPVVTTVMSHGISFQRKSGNSAAAGSQASPPPHFGSQQWLLRGHMVSFRSADISSYARKTVFVPVETHVSPDEWKQLMALPVRGVVAVTSPFDRHNEMLLQHFLSREAIPIPVYFLPYDDAAADKLKRTFDELSFNEYAVISVGNSTRDTAMTTNSSFTGIYIHTSLKVKPKEATESTPRLLVTASFDTLGVSPASRTTGGASATVAAVELWWRLQADAVQMAGKHTGNGGNVFPSEPYSVSLLLGNTARFNYAGTGRWLSTQKEEDMDRYALVLCLDELLSDGYDDGLFSADGSAGTVNSNHKTNGAVQLYMHVHDSFSSDPYFLHVKRLAEGAATKHGITLATQVTKTNYQHYDINFEHEVLAHRQIHAVTISSTRRQRVGQLFRGSSLPLSMGLNASSGDAALARRLSRTVDFVYDFSRGIFASP
uniref:Uncharacterized protein n=1 Tax=Trypanosoma congolense (strain IL3000) TaxID=1068625 RepID=G0UPE0_TRYCI|nr:conserved hypothetical protein [Trypanosoma congolense IL3000]